MDIEYLLWFQNFREATGNIFTPFMAGYSDFAVSILAFVPAIIYWCMNKRNGLYLFTSYGVSRFINGILKVTFCVYRPWIRDSRIIPVEDAIKSATGYSFPSGHVMNTTPMFGGIGVISRKKYAWISFLCAIGILLTAISRNYLGVHTPQDVFVGMIFGLLVLYFVAKIFAYIVKNPEKENYFIAAGLILCVLAVIYVKNKSYPMDYVDGKLIVDPKKMMSDTYKDIGIFAGVLIGRYVEKTFVKFSPDGLNIKSVLLAVIGCVLYHYIHYGFRDIVRELMGKDLGNFASMFSLMFFTIALWPVVLKIFKASK